jgi:hypothetical protein
MTATGKSESSLQRKRKPAGDTNPFSHLIAHGFRLRFNNLEYTVAIQIGVDNDSGESRHTVVSLSVHVEIFPLGSVNFATQTIE